MASSSGVSKPAPRRVLLTNDDGPDSPFFTPWVTHVREVLGWDAVVGLPAAPQSFVSKSISRGPIKANKIEEAHYEIEGSPASCVNIALYNFASDCDFVVAGPNLGHNLGRGSLLSSGTVGAAMEGAIAGRRAVALSFPFFNGWHNWTEQEIADAVIASGKTVQQLWQEWPDKEPGEEIDLYNVNVPLDLRDESFAANRGTAVVTTVDHTSQYSSLYELNEETGLYEWQPKGLRVFQVKSPDPGSDVAAVQQGKISITPLRTAFVGA